MKICGFNKTSLLDYPGRIACTIFLGGCNYRCPFCQNSGLVLSVAEQPEYSWDEVLKFLKKRQGILEGVCITGGEPTLSAELSDFLREIKQLGYPVKLDTNGSRPGVVKALVEEKIVDKVAMDIKTSIENYGLLTGLDAPDTGAVKETASFLMNSGIEYEFRTTVISQYHTENDFREIGEWIRGAKNYFLQGFTDRDAVPDHSLTAPTPEDMIKYRDTAAPFVGFAAIRGVDID